MAVRIRSSDVSTECSAHRKHFINGNNMTQAYKSRWIFLLRFLSPGGIFFKLTFNVFNAFLTYFPVILY